MVLHILKGDVATATWVLVMLCGMGSTADSFVAAQAPALSGLLVVALDYTELDSIHTMASSVWSQLDQAGIMLPTVLLGYSMGGFVAQAAACQQPARVCGIVLVSTAILNIDDMHDALDAMSPRMLAALTLHAPGTHAYEHAKAQLLFSSRWLQQHEKEYNQRRRGTGNAPRAVFLAEIRAVVAHALTNDNGQSAQCMRNYPVLVLHGGQDVLFPAAATLRRMAQYIPHALVFQAASSGHALLTEQTLWAVTVLTRWLVTMQSTCCSTTQLV